MKKLFAFVLAFALLLSGCGKVPEVIEPTEIESSGILEETSSEEETKGLPENEDSSG